MLLFTNLPPFLISLRSHSLNSLIALLIGLSPLNLYASNEPNQTIPILIDGKWLQNKMVRQPNDLVLIDLRSPTAYEAGHIPGAINLPFPKFNRSINEVKGFLLTPLNFQELMEKSGISQDDHLILYSDKTVLDSTRVYWSFDFYGHNKLSVLDGGLKAWQKVGGKIEIQPNTLEPSTYQVSIQPKKFASKFKTLMATKQENTLIVDARPEQEYQGLESRTDQFGHIPTAINLPWKQLVEPSDKPPTEESYFRYKTLNKLQEQFEIIPENKKIILYCNGGRESSVLYFGLKLLGREAALYDGSWFEWSSDKSLPKTSPVKRGQNESH